MRHERSRRGGRPAEQTGPSGNPHEPSPARVTEGAARAQHLAVVPLDKPGCLLGDAHKNLPGWPCADWYRWAVRQDHRLRPVMTIVAYQFSLPLQNHPSTTIPELQAVLVDVTRGVLLEDPPGQTQQPAECIAEPGATMGTCSSRVPSSYVPFMRDVAAMVRRTHHPAIPTLQWFCGRGVCPMVVDHTLTERDKSHLTTEYSAELAPLLGLELRPILAAFEHRSVHSAAAGSTPSDGSGLMRPVGVGAAEFGVCQCTPSARRSASSRRAMCL